PAGAAVRELVRTSGPLVIVQSAGCCDGSAPMVLPAEDFLLGRDDIRVGCVEDVPVSINARELDAWAHGDLELDVASGYADGFSLGPADGHHFVSRSDACLAPTIPTTPTTAPETIEVKK
ncbi:MAG: DUF779 domain-containing protein, partial [Nocardioides sp.]|nr:DUF779 domain-containing protein [Nocardioides sp.]